MATVSSSKQLSTGRLVLAVAVLLLLPLAGIAWGAAERPRPAQVRVSVATPAEEPSSAPDIASQRLQTPTLTPPTLPPERFNPFPRWSREDNLTMLLVGVDRRNERDIFRTDTVILGHVDFRGRRGTLISIPRDLVVSIPGFYQDRINTVYALGETQKRPAGGLELLRTTVERNFGVTIDHYAVIDFKCFRGAVDALGGVIVNVERRIYDPLYPTDDYGYKALTIEAGRQSMNGERALEYVRTRYGDSDFGRMRRQQQVLSAVKEQALKVQNLTALPQAAVACAGMSSDLGIFELVALGAAARHINQADISQRVIDERMAVPFTAASGASMLQPRWEEIRALVRASIRGPSTSASAGP
jgi:LCP family protein required for cell wall assembly